jgi:membrane protease YdiL (CAAX protease family)
MDGMPPQQEQGKQLQEQTNRVTNTIPRGLQFALYLTAMAWAATANAIAPRAASGIAVRLNLGMAEPLLGSLFLVFLIVVGFRVLDWLSSRGRYAEDALPLPLRAGWQREWGVGAAIGWGLCIAAALPLLVTGNLHARLGWHSGTALAVVLALLNLLVATLAQEMVYRGYAFRRLIAAIGPSWAAIVVSLVFAALIVQANPPRNVLVAFVDCVFFGLLLAMAWLRTHALWLGWGLHFAYRAVAAVLLGLPIAGRGEFGSPTDMFASGPRWLSGGAFGLDAAVLTSVAMLGGMIVLYRASRDYAWEYTHPPIVPAGYEVTVAPPAAHVAMEKAATAAPPPLVQIMPSTPQTRSVVDAGSSQ